MLQKRNSKVVKTAFFNFTLTVVATFIGFILSLYVMNLQNEIEKKETAVGLLETAINVNKSEMSYVCLRTGMLEGYLNDDIDQLFLYSTESNDDGINLFIDNGVCYSVFTKLFRDNIFYQTEQIKQYKNAAQTSSTSEKNNQDTLEYLKMLLVYKYTYHLLLVNEEQYINGGISRLQHEENINEILDEKQKDLIIKVWDGAPLKEIIPPIKEL